MEKKEYFVEILGDLRVEVAVSAFGKFVRMRRKMRWIPISEKGWRFIINNVALIDKSMSEKTDYGLTITANKSVRVSMFEDQPYLQFVDTNKATETKSYINLNINEWSELRKKMDIITALLNCDVIWERISGSWSYVKETQISDYRLVPTQSDLDVNAAIAAYLIRRKIAELELMDVPQDETTGEKLTEWKDIVDQRFNEAYRVVSVANALNAINTALGWNVGLESLYGRLDKMKRVVKCPTKLSPSGFKDFVAVVSNTLDQLGFSDQ